MKELTLVIKVKVDDSNDSSDIDFLKDISANAANDTLKLCKLYGGTEVIIKRKIKKGFKVLDNSKLMNKEDAE